MSSAWIAATWQGWIQRQTNNIDELCSYDAQSVQRRKEKQPHSFLQIPQRPPPFYDPWCALNLPGRQKAPQHSEQSLIRTFPGNSRYTPTPTGFLPEATGYSRFHTSIMLFRGSVPGLVRSASCLIHVWPGFTEWIQPFWILIKTQFQLRRGSGWQYSRRLGRLTNVGQDTLDHRPLNDEGDDPHGLATPGAAQRKTLINTGQQHGPTANGCFADVGSAIYFRRVFLQAHFLLCLLKNLQGGTRWTSCFDDSLAQPGVGSQHPAVPMLVNSPSFGQRS